MSSAADRNPTPPPEILENNADFVPDRIGDSMYSKRWLYKTLMNMLKVVQEYDSTRNDSNCAGSDNANQNIMELEPKIEEDACALWDMTANSEVSEFLCEINVAEIFLSIIEHTKSPRLLEIVVGILGNMTSFSFTCEYISKNKSLVHSIISLTGCSDSCTLVQLFRLLNCGVSSKICEKEWFSAFDENAFFMENMKIILQNNLCFDVLKAVLDFLDCILNENSSYCSIWSEQTFTAAVIESGKQLLKCNHYAGLDSFFSVVNTLCQDSSSISAFAEQFEVLKPVFHGYFLKLGEEELLPETSRVVGITCGFATYGNLLRCTKISTEHVTFDDGLFQGILHLSNLIETFLLNFKLKKSPTARESKDQPTAITKPEERNGSSSEHKTDENIITWSTLLEAIVFAVKACSTYTVKESDINVLNTIMNLNIPEIIENTDASQS